MVLLDLDGIVGGWILNGVGVHISEWKKRRQLPPNCVQQCTLQLLSFRGFLDNEPGINANNDKCQATLLRKHCPGIITLSFYPEYCTKRGNARENEKATGNS